MLAHKSQTQAHNSDFHRAEYAKFYNIMDTGKITALNQMVSSRAGNRYCWRKQKTRKIGKIKSKSSPGYPAQGLGKSWQRGPPGRGNNGKQEPSQAGEGRKGRQGSGHERTRPGHGPGAAPRAAGAEARVRPTRRRARGRHLHLADELLAEVGAAPVGLRPGHVHGGPRERLPPPPPAAALGLRRGTAAPPLPAREGSREMESRSEPRQQSRDLPDRCEARWEM